MKKIKTFNQSHHIGQPDNLRKIIFKHDGCSMVLFRNLPIWKASQRIDALKKMYPDWCGQLIITR